VNFNFIKYLRTILKTSKNTQRCFDLGTSKNVNYKSEYISKKFKGHIYIGRSQTKT
jgi:hypothetical protein